MSLHAQSLDTLTTPITTLVDHHILLSLEQLLHDLLAEHM